MLLAVLISALSAFLVGINISIINAPEEVCFPGHTTTQWSFAVAAFAVGGPAGAVIGGKSGLDRAIERSNAAISDSRAAARTHCLPAESLVTVSQRSSWVGTWVFAKNSFLVWERDYLHLSQVLGKTPKLAL